ncbi:MAG: mevalonate kinase [Thaumarchaeota archaeon]|nr:mevalonate kinase [Nitrososphaerota archaeon]
MKSIASAPGKIILAGEHFVVHGTKSILCSINMRVNVTAEFMSKKIIITSDICNVIIDDLSDNTINIIRPFICIIKKIFNKYNYVGGIKIIIKSDIPVGVGLGSSSACCVAVAASVSGLFGKITKKCIVELAKEGEKTIFENTSGADCTICTYGGIIEYDKKFGFKKINTNKKINLLVINSMTRHSTDLTVKKVMKFKHDNKKHFDLLCKKELLLIKKLKHSLINNNLNSIGTQMKKNQEYLRQIGVSNKTIDNLIRQVNYISYGAKITGAGDGGCIIVLIDKQNEDKLINSINENYKCFQIENERHGVTVNKQN